MSSKKSKKARINKKLKAIRSRAIGIARSKKTWVGLILSLIIILAVLTAIGIGSYVLFHYVISPLIWPSNNGDAPTNDPGT